MLDKDRVSLAAPSPGLKCAGPQARKRVLRPSCPPLRKRTCPLEPTAWVSCLTTTLRNGYAHGLHEAYVDRLPFPGYESVVAGPAVARGEPDSSLPAAAPLEMTGPLHDHEVANAALKIAAATSGGIARAAPPPLSSRLVRHASKSMSPAFLYSDGHAASMATRRVHRPGSRLVLIVFTSSGVAPLG